MNMTNLKDFAIIVGGLVTIFAFVNGLLEYRRQGAQKRVEHFTLLRRRLKENRTFKEICALMLANDPRLAEIDAQDKRDFIGLLEEVALQVNSGLIRPELAHYMFGYYTVKCLENKHFWANLTLDENYWNLFQDFAKEMKAKELSHTYKREKLRF
ncbi:hypothetical protein [Pelotalea chapellei]|uniref:DUF4760 domain-containing protein n=1 Tax=Pelotalea chapellei TaxID=44671 RepID=A0ABS5UAD6_9BACT|nr:hypothetical protein [Pelotalea chapellei]MBT1072600.1 hypothetical protein [Pelotalea chapellei]